MADKNNKTGKKKKTSQTAKKNNAGKNSSAKKKKAADKSSAGQKKKADEKIEKTDSRLKEEIAAIIMNDEQLKILKARFGKTGSEMTPNNFKQAWGTFGILIPIVVIICKSALVTNPSLMVVTLAATLGGSVFGDHCSPISDTTILSSTGANCPHIDHVSTQLPYALTVAVSWGWGRVPARLL